MLIKVTTMNLWGTPPPAGIFASKSRAVSTMCRSVAGSVKPEAKRVLENKIANCKLHPVQHFYFGKKKTYILDTPVPAQMAWMVSLFLTPFS